MTERVVVCDTSFLLELQRQQLSAAFFRLPWTVFTTDLVLHQLKRSGQLEGLVAYLSEGRIGKVCFDGGEMLRLLTFHRAHPQFSLHDCSALSFASDNGYTLLTCTPLLRQAVSETEVLSLSYVIDSVKVYDRMININMV